MLTDRKLKAHAALKRLNGLSAKISKLIDDGAYCPEILRNVLAMKGHIEYLQEQILESHIQTCSTAKLSSPKEKVEFIRELLTVVGLSKR